MKKAYLITYDLKTPAPHYDEIIRIIRRLCWGLVQVLGILIFNYFFVDSLRYHRQVETLFEFG